ncbi:MAG: hypothetical protein BGO98_21410 [Myxococcales bacterium 68-20]|nr:hypothetical protein [Myxococcales bacterium]OJY28116.1 MAG: hypothetical protein BGO98_21410 [Myxococcales bacterium 68-20]
MHSGKQLSFGRSGAGLWRAILFAVPTCAMAWGAGCADEASPVTQDDVDGGDAEAVDSSSPPNDAGSDASKRDCTADLDADGIHKHLECTGLYSSFADKTVATDVKPYKPGLEFWSDGAEKQRWVHLPAGSKIDIADWNEWVYPPGTKLWKEFKIGGKRIETRFFTKLPDNSWAHTAYRWNADETDAVRKDGGETIDGIGLDGGPYEIPSTGQCDQCHMGRKDQVLGFDAVSLGLATATGQTLEKLAAEGALSKAPPATTLAFPGSPVASAAVGWVHTNCGACHNANTNASAGFKSHFLVRATDLAPADGGAPATLEELDVWTQSYCVDTFRADPDGGAYKYIRGGSPERSLMSVLAGSRVPAGDLPTAGAQMPPIVSRAVDQEGVKLLDDWIATLLPCQ